MDTLEWIDSNQRRLLDEAVFGYGDGSDDAGFGYGYGDDNGYGPDYGAGYGQGSGTGAGTGAGVGKYALTGISSVMETGFGRGLNGQGHPFESESDGYGRG